jgi:hypothetical protein
VRWTSRRKKTNNCFSFSCFLVLKNFPNQIAPLLSSLPHVAGMHGRCNSWLPSQSRGWLAPVILTRELMVLMPPDTTSNRMRLLGAFDGVLAEGSCCLVGTGYPFRIPLVVSWLQWLSIVVLLAA